MLHVANLMILLVLFSACPNMGWGQVSLKESPSQKYQDYLKMMETLNDLNKDYGMKLQIPVNEKKWKKLYSNDKQELESAYKNKEYKYNPQSNEPY